MVNDPDRAYKPLKFFCIPGWELMSASESEMVAASVTEGLLAVRGRIARAADDYGRGGLVKLVCVSKTVSVESIRVALEAGERIFGENRVQEAQAKWPELKREFPDVELHLIGPLQSNKVREAVELFDVIETVDRVKIAEAIAREVEATGRRPRLYVEVNTGDEPQKAGVRPDKADEFLADCTRRLQLKVDGLMCIPPFGAPCSPHFALLAEIARRNEIKNLSMGMSSDFELAIQLGATYVRVGSAIFGHRT